MKIYDYDAVIIGSGCAGFNAADCLYNNGITNIALVAENINYGTSRNAGSDKQTYYKLALSGKHDSVDDMAESLFAGGSVDGDIALCEAANSAYCFFKLVNLGMDFPKNEYGEYVGYKTDHDNSSRATSMGPFTSKIMTECLQSSLKEKNAEIFDKLMAVELITSDNKICGLLCLNLNKNIEDDDYFVLFITDYVIMCTGAPANLYFDSVFPISQTGMSGMALKAGAIFSNFNEWQYGLASVKFRWNVSGSYQQVIPRYVSVDQFGNEREFLSDYIKDNNKISDLIFLKGYEWPFDAAKIGGSSLIDFAVYNETKNKGNRVYLDYTHDSEFFNLNNCSDIVQEYLNNSLAVGSTPYERLIKLNPAAIDVYRNHGIDISKEKLEIAVCAQHNNGGLQVDSDWMTSLNGLFAAGECAGTFGIYRPGGSALNSAQVGSMRASLKIASNIKKNQNRSIPEEKTQNIALSKIDCLKEQYHQSAGDKNTFREYLMSIKKIMSAHFGPFRNIENMKTAKKELEELKNNFKILNKCSESKYFYCILKNHDTILSAIALAEAEIFAAESAGSRGGALVCGKDNIISEDMSYREKIFNLFYKDDKIHLFCRNRKAIPARELWFEKVWNNYRR